MEQILINKIVNSTKKSGLALRPSKDFLRLLHLIREHAAAVAYRPISLGNVSYLIEKLDELRKLNSKLHQLLPNIKGEWNNIAQAVSNKINKLHYQSSQQEYGFLVHYCDQAGYRNFWDLNTNLIPVYEVPLLRKKYTTVCFIIGTALGIGDEISCTEFIYNIMYYNGDARYTLFTNYPNFWELTFPKANVVKSSGEPLKPFEYIDFINKKENTDNYLIVFVNFSGMDFHKAYCFDNQAPDIAEISVGKGTLWFKEKKTNIVQVIDKLDTLFPSNYSALRELSLAFAGICKQFPTPNSQKPNKPENKYRIVLNPLTSKTIVLSPVDWLKIVYNSLDGIETSLEIECVLLPGLTKHSLDYSRQIMQLNTNGKLKFKLLGGGKPLSSENALYQVYKLMQTANLLVGIDTYTAHLAGVLNIPSVSLCYNRNIAFWTEAPNSFWIELKSGQEMITQLISFVVNLTLMRENEVLFLTENSSKHSMLFLRNIKKLTSDNTDKYDVKEIYENGNLLWNELPEKTKALLKEIDYKYSWHIVANQLGELSGNKNALQRLARIVDKTHFAKIIKLNSLNIRNTKEKINAAEVL